MREQNTAVPLPRPLILGHRGAPLRAPENSLRAFAAALEAGADGVELDVRQASDGVPVVIHDATLDRTGHGEGPVAARTRAELSRLRGGGEAIPSLEEAAEWAAHAGAWVNVELKDENVEEASLAILRRAGILERTLLSSFSTRTMERLRRLAPDVRRFLLVDSWHEGVPGVASDAGVDGICLRVDAASRLALDVLRRGGYGIVVWTVDDPERIRELVQAGVDGIITNRPEEARRSA